MTAVEFLKQNGVLKHDEEDRVVLTAWGTVSLVKLLNGFQADADSAVGDIAHPTEVSASLKPDAEVVDSTGDKDHEGAEVHEDVEVKNKAAKPTTKKK